LRPSAPPEGGRYRVRLFRDRKDYITIGKAPPDTAGIYSFDDRTNKVPFDSLGLVRDGDRWRMDPEHYETHTLIHETTHQLMHDWGEILPLWVAEGLAESVACIPYRTGNLLVGDWNKGVAEYLDKTIFHAVLAAAVELSQEIAVSPSPEQHPLFARIEQVLTMAESPPPPASELCSTMGITLADPVELVTLSHNRFMSRGEPVPPIARKTSRFAPDRQIPVSFHYLTSLVIAHHFLAREGPAGPRRLRAYLMRMQLIQQETLQWIDLATDRSPGRRREPRSPSTPKTGAPAFVQGFLTINLERDHPYSHLALPALLLNQSPSDFRSRVSTAAGLPLRNSDAE
jgi:hypothetical protein